MSGFTLLELLMVIFLITITAVFVIPSYQSLITQSTGYHAGEQLLQSIQMARQEAILRDVPVTFCSSVNHTTCSGDWRDGQLLFTDPTQQGVPASSEDKISAFSHPLTGTLHWQSALKHPYLQFLSSGMAQENGTFWYCDKNAKHPAWKIIISQSGRARLSHPVIDIAC